MALVHFVQHGRWCNDLFMQAVTIVTLMTNMTYLQQARKNIVLYGQLNFA